MKILQNLITTSHKKVIRANMTKLKVTKLDVVTKRIRHRVNGVLDIGIRTGNGWLRISKSCMFMYCAPLLCHTHMALCLGWLMYIYIVLIFTEIFEALRDNALLFHKELKG